MVPAVKTIHYKNPVELHFMGGPIDGLACESASAYVKTMMVESPQGRIPIGVPEDAWGPNVYRRSSAECPPFIYDWIGGGQMA